MRSEDLDRRPGQVVFGSYPKCSGSDFSHVKRLMWWSPRAAHPRIGRCGWNAVAEIGDPRFCCRKLEYGSSSDNSLPSRLNTLTACAEVPLQNKLAD